MKHQDQLKGEANSEKVIKETLPKANGGNVLKTAFNNNFSLATCIRSKRMLGFSFVLALILMISGSNQGAKSTGPKYGDSLASQTTPGYHFAIHPLHNPSKLIHSYQPLIDYLNGKLMGARLILEASRDYANFEEKYKVRTPEFLLPNP